ncbi:MAG: ArsR family transcriptional regulator [Methylophaga sp.]|nr:MAG: ArsR family transcriptional regulator [Methylophaga sp.]
MDNKQKGIRIRSQILKNLRFHPKDIVKHISSIFNITPQAVYRHIKYLENEKRLVSTGQRKGKQYFLGDIREHIISFEITEGFAEDIIWRDHFAYLLDGEPDNIVEICHYGFTEMLNNAIDHSESEGVHIGLRRDEENILIAIADDGEGIFRRIKRLCNLEDENQALFELSKGKLTTDPENHTGEGIFFTSRSFDKFAILSKGLHFAHDDNEEYDFLEEVDDNFGELGTQVQMLLRRNSKRKLQSVFDGFTAGPEDFQFNKTIIPVKLAQYGNEKLVSRSQAKRLLTRIDKFEHVIFDFEGVEGVGQAFADEIFRVYANKNPNITLIPKKMVENVQKMVKRALNA